MCYEECILCSKVLWVNMLYVLTSLWDCLAGKQIQTNFRGSKQSNKKDILKSVVHSLVLFLSLSMIEGSPTSDDHVYFD